MECLLMGEPRIRIHWNVHGKTSCCKDDMKIDERNGETGRQCGFKVSHMDSTYGIQDESDDTVSDYNFNLSLIIWSCKIKAIYNKAFGSDRDKP